ncbi:MAG: helix-turn-helix domain-containing protein [Chloroflexota bacterium]|nr:helix-turn-helix domain-containing protein [Dehalococcoidales bacterium]
MGSNNGKSAVLTVEEAAQYLRVHEQTVYQLLRTGQLKGAKVGRVWRIHRASVDAFLMGENGSGDGADL